MNEPLKGKEGYVQSWEIIDLDKIRECNNTTKIFEAEDIKSAVEWLKEKLYDCMVSEYEGAVAISPDYNNVKKLLDEAFEDITSNSANQKVRKDE